MCLVSPHQVAVRVEQIDGERLGAADIAQRARCWLCFELDGHGRVLSLREIAGQRARQCQRAAGNCCHRELLGRRIVVLDLHGIAYGEQRHIADGDLVCIEVSVCRELRLKAVAIDADHIAWRRIAQRGEAEQLPVRANRLVLEHGRTPRAAVNHKVPAAADRVIGERLEDVQIQRPR